MDEDIFSYVARPEVSLGEKCLELSKILELNEFIGFDHQRLVRQRSGKYNWNYLQMTTGSPIFTPADLLHVLRLMRTNTEMNNKQRNYFASILSELPEEPVGYQWWLPHMTELCTLP